MRGGLSELVKAVSKVGVQNVSLLSRMTGMPTETIRYTIKKRFPSMGLEIRTYPDYEQLGLDRYFVTIDLGSAPEERMRKELSSRAFLTSWCDATLDRYGRRFCMFAVPITMADEFVGFLNKTAKKGVITDYHMERLSWSRYPELNSACYDFGNGSWTVDWKKVAAMREQAQSYRTADAVISPEIDNTDMLIIKEIELDSWRNIADIGRKLGMNERTVRWHYAKHVAGISSSTRVNWRPGNSDVGIVHQFYAMQKSVLNSLREIFANFPFVQFEAGREDGYYHVQSTLPVEHLMPSLRFLDGQIGELISAWQTYVADPQSARWYTIPYENFDSKQGWEFDANAALAALQG